MKQVDRRSGIGGSDIAAILGVSKWKTPSSLWLDKTSEEPLVDEDNIVLRFGHFVEEFVAQEYTRRTGLLVEKYNKELIHHKYNFIRGNIDRLVIPAGCKKASHKSEIRTNRLLECKTASGYTANQWGESGTDQAPIYYLTQVHWYMMLTGCEYADIAVLIGNNDFRIYTIKKDEKLQAAMLQKAVDFWQNCVKGDQMPLVVTQEDLDRLYPKSINKKVEASEALISQINDLKTYKDAIKKTEKQCFLIEKNIKEHMQEADTLVYNNKVLATWRTNKFGTRVFRLNERMI